MMIGLTSSISTMHIGAARQGLIVAQGAKEALPDAVLSHVRVCRPPMGYSQGAAELTVAPMPMPTGLTAMAQGETPTPVNPKFRAATES